MLLYLLYAVYSDDNQTNWDLYLPLVLLAYRTSQQTTTEASPFEILYGREPRLPSDLDIADNYPSPFIESINYGWQEAKRQILKKGLINKAFYDKKYQSSSPEYIEGEYERLKNHTIKPGLKKKLQHNKWSEPIKVSKIISPQNIEVVVNNKSKVVNVNNVKKSEVIRS